jgi:RNA polymerase sigma-70 factor (ECF subfamily)
MREHQADLWRYLRLLGCDASRADDLTQETFLYVLRHGLVEYSSAATASYLRRAARNLLLNLLRRESRHVPLGEWDEADRAWDDLTRENSDARIDKLRGCLQLLGDRAREALKLRYGDGLGEAEVAARLGASEEAEKALLKRARAAQRACIERQADHERS